jgi:hypothetical protein
VEKCEEVVWLENLRQTPATPLRVVVLILSAFAEPWRTWQKNGQDQTFLEEIPEGVKALRFSGLPTNKKLKFKFAILLKRTQHSLQKIGWLGSLPVLSGVLGYISKLRFGDSTIAGIKSPSSSCEFIQGPSSKSAIDVIFTPVPSNPELIGLSTIEAFRYVLENYEFEYIFRTNSSSYVNLHKLLKLTEALPKTRVYAGFEGTILRTTKFASGAGYLISRDIVEEICLDPQLWRHGLIDDVALADFVNTSLRSRVKQIPLPRATIAKISDINALPPHEIQNQFHYRCKTDSTFETVEIMHQIRSLEERYKVED